MTSTWKAFIGVILIFIFGFFSGVICSSIFVHKKIQDFLRNPGVALAAAVEKRLTRNLDLDATQKEQIHGYFADNVTQRKQLQKQIQPQVQLINRETFEQISAILRPDQLDLFHKNLQEMRKNYGKSAMNADSPTASGVQPAISGTNSTPATPAGQ